MPSYDYKCKNCGHRWTVVCSISEHDSSPPCPNCGETETEHVWDDGRAPAWHMK